MRHLILPFWDIRYYIEDIARTYRKGGAYQGLERQLRNAFNITLCPRGHPTGEVGDPIHSKQHRMQHL